MALRCGLALQSDSVLSRCEVPLHGFALYYSRWEAMMYRAPDRCHFLLLRHGRGLSVEVGYSSVAIRSSLPLAESFTQPSACYKS